MIDDAVAAGLFSGILGLSVGSFVGYMVARGLAARVIERVLHNMARGARRRNVYGSYGDLARLLIARIRKHDDAQLQLDWK